jgi:hypothetical protein
MFDGFTLQGGDVQIHATTFLGAVEELNGIISNCVFDMRHMWKPDPESTAMLAGPYFGIMMTKHWFDNNQCDTLGYADQKVVIANNTFILAEYTIGAVSTLSRPEAVAIIDVTNPSCDISITDPDRTMRGVGNPHVINNLGASGSSVGS